MHNPSPTQAWACLCVSLSICAFPINAQVAQRAQGRILDRGEDFTVFENTRVAPDGNRQTNQFTLLENALNYQENGEWKISEDLIESFPGGALARRGPHQAIFSEDLNTQFAFDIETSAGQRIRGGLRSIQATDFRTGETVTFGTLKESVKAGVAASKQINLSICIRRN
jgi:hypothetical protein